MSWVLPDSPKHPAYARVMGEIDRATGRDQIEMRAQLCEADFYAYLKLVSAFGRYLVNDEDHDMHGQLWVDHPRVFQMAREIQRVIEERIDDYFFNWARFHFKDLALDTPVPTPGGWRRHGDLCVGDQVFAVDGSPTKVVGTSEVFEKECYLVEFAGGEGITAGAGHLWDVVAKRKRRTRGPKRLVYDRLVVTTEELADLLRDGEHISLPETGPAQYPERVLPIDPYVLGAWLGDGATADGRLTNIDQPIWDELSGAGYSFGRWDGAGQTRTVYGLRVQLRQLGVLGRKHVPDEYLRSGAAQRLALLQGLMDTDGTVTYHGDEAVFTNSNRQLLAEVSEVAWSLGIPNRLHFYENGFAGAGFLMLKPRRGERLFRLDRKQSRLKTVRRHARRVRAVFPAGVVKSSCLMVAHPSSTYLVGKTFIPTHNTQLITQEATLWELTRDSSLTFAIITHKTDQVGMQIFSGIRAAATETIDLQVHWPHIFAPAADLPLNTNTAFTILREAGPREPTVSIHPLDNLPAGGHYRRIKVDDSVVAKSVDTPGAISRTLRQMRRIGPLAQDDTLTTWIGTIWAPNDPYMVLLRAASDEDRLFMGRSLLTAYEHPEGLEWTANSDPEDWTPTLHSRSFLKKWHRKLGPYDFAAQMQQTTIAKTEQGFDRAWVCYYQNLPRDEAKSKEVVLMVDAAGGDETKDGDDFWVFRVYGLGADQNLCALDLWRENLSLDEALTLTFALVKFWKPKATYTEDYGQTMLIPAILREQEAKGFRFPLDRFPPIKRPKEARISLLQPEYRAGRFWYPTDGFGHGSGPRYVDALVRAAGERVEKMRDRVRDSRDTMIQFFDDELSRWVPRKKSIPNDDCLDLEAWTVQPEVYLPFPQFDASVPEYNRIPESHGGQKQDVERLYQAVGYWGL